MTPTITATYTAILAIFYVVISACVITPRAKTNVLVGQSDNMNPLVATRCHGNLSEFMPFAILKMGVGVLLGLGST